MSWLPIVLARRELRGSLKGFGIFVACLALGVATIAAAASLDAALRRSLSEDSQALLGGDAELRQLTLQKRTQELLQPFETFSF